jgi:hypothetical protein
MATVKSEEFTVTLNSQTCWYLDRLIETGLYGNKHTEVIKIALYDHCKLLIADGKLKMAPPLPGAAAIPVSGTNET